MALADDFSASFAARELAGMGSLYRASGRGADEPPW